MRVKGLLSIVSPSANFIDESTRRLDVIVTGGLTGKPAGTGGKIVFQPLAWFGLPGMRLAGRTGPAAGVPAAVAPVVAGETVGAAAVDAVAAVVGAGALATVGAAAAVGALVGFAAGAVVGALDGVAGAGAEVQLAISTPAATLPAIVKKVRREGRRGRTASMMLSPCGGGQPNL